MIKKLFSKFFDFVAYAIMIIVASILLHLLINIWQYEIIRVLTFGVLTLLSIAWATKRLCNKGN